MEPRPDVALAVLEDFDDPVFRQALRVRGIIYVLVESEIGSVEPQQASAHTDKPEIPVARFYHLADARHKTVGGAAERYLPDRVLSAIVEREPAARSPKNPEKPFGIVKKLELPRFDSQRNAAVNLSGVRIKCLEPVPGSHPEDALAVGGSRFYIVGTQAVIPAWWPARLCWPSCHLSDGQV